MIELNKNLKDFNTFGISVYADRFAQFSSIEELQSILNQRNGSDLLILGGGSNLLLTKDFKGLVIKNDIKKFEIKEETTDSVIVESGAGENWHSFVLKCIKKGYGGIENLSLIPGSVGASPMQNIGASPARSSWGRAAAPATAGRPTRPRPPRPRRRTPSPSRP